MTTLGEAFGAGYRRERKARKPVLLPAVQALGVVLGTLVPYLLPCLGLALVAVGGFVLAAWLGFMLSGVGVLGLFLLVELRGGVARG